MVLAVLDLCFNVVCERMLLGTGARVLWLARFGAVPLEEQMQSAGPALIAGTLTWTFLAAALFATLS